MKKSNLKTCKLLAVGAFALALCGVTALVPTEADAATATSGFTMETTTSIRFPKEDETSGIRFTANLSNEYLKEKLVTSETDGALKLESYKDADDRFGMIIVPERYLTDAEFGFNNQVEYTDYYQYFTQELGHIVDIQHTKISDITVKDGAYSIRGSLVDIYMQNFNLDFVGIGYFYDGTTYEYAAPANGTTYHSANVAEVAAVTLEEDIAELETEEIAELESIVENGRLSARGVKQTATAYTYGGNSYETKEELLAANLELYVDKTENVTHTYNNGTTITGTQYTFRKSDVPVKLAENVPFEGKMISLGYANQGGNYKIAQSTIRFTDVTTGKTLELIFFLNPDAVGSDACYAGWTYDGKAGAVISLPVLGIDLSDRGSGAWWGAQLPRTLTISVGTDGNGNQSVLFNNGFAADDWKQYFYGSKALDLTGFGANGVNVEMEVDWFNEASEASVIISEVAKPAIVKTENYTHTYNSGTTITGTKYTVSATNKAVSIVKGKAFSGELLTLGYANNGGAYQIQKSTVRFTDVTTKKTLEITFFLNVDIVAADSVYVGYSYNGTTTAPTAHHLFVDLADTVANGSAGPFQTVTLSVGATGALEFTNCFTSWTNYIPGLDLTGFGVDGVDIEVEINAFNNVTEASFIVK